MNRTLKKLIISVLLLPILFIAGVLGFIYWQQDNFVNTFLETFNKDFVGEIEIQDSHISLFKNFPHISIDLVDVHIWEGKDKHDIRPIIEVQDLYLGIDFRNLFNTGIDIDYIRAENGELDLILHEDNTINVVNALSSPKKEQIKEIAEELHIHLKTIQLKNLDIHKFDEKTKTDIETFVTDADISFQSTPGHVKTELKSNFVLNVIDDGDTTFIRHKHFFLDTHLDFLEEKQILVINPSDVNLEHGVFGIEGEIDVLDSLNMDLKIHGNKPNFDLLIAFAPEELIPTLEKYENAGTIYFEGIVKGKAVGGMPEIMVDFGCDKAWFKNTTNNKMVQQMHFEGHFANTLSEAHDLSAMEFSIKNFSANPEAGHLQANLEVKNFDSPEIEMDINTDFNLDFLSKFFNVEFIEDLKGEVILDMKFHDIVDLAHPEKSIAKLNEAYYSKLSINNLSFKLPDYHLPIDTLNMKVHMDGHEADIDYFDLKIGKSDLHINGLVSDLPAILHHTDDLIDSRLNITSNFLDLFQLTNSPDTNAKPVDEQIENLRLKLDFKSSARAFTESKHLPEGEFFIEDLYAQLKHYPHSFHDFHADLYVEEEDLRIIDFSGMIDKSDFHFIGKLHDYGFWFKDTLQGDTRLEFDFLADHLRLEDIFSYKGENYVPKEYRHEELTGLKIHGFTDLHFTGGFQAADVRITRLDAKMKIHPLKFKNFNGRIHYEDDHVQIDTLFGEIGKSSFTMDLNYYLGKDEAIRKRDNHLGLHAQRLDLDGLLNYHAPPVEVNNHVDHEDVFNIYDLPFTPMTFDLDVKQINYDRVLIKDLNSRFRTETDHYIRIDTLFLRTAGGEMELNGYFDGRDRDKIFLDPVITLRDINLDRLLFKFENFGQDHVVSENLHGLLSGTITGHIHIHPDLVPKLDDSELHIDLEVLDGRLENYEPILAMSDYFGDKNLSTVRFDSLKNHLDIKNGKMVIPRMTLNTSLGHLDLSGEQSVGEDYAMNYNIHIPMRMVTKAAKSKLFGGGNKAEADSLASTDEEEIVFKDHTEKIRYVNLNILGDSTDYKIKLGKGKKKKKKKN